MNQTRLDPMRAGAGLVALLLLSYGLGVQAIPVSIVAPTEAMRQALEQTLPIRRLRALEDQQGTSFWVRRLLRAGPRSLEPLGYYEARLTVDEQQQPLLVEVHPGPEVRVASLDIVLGTDRVDPAQFPLSVGDVLDHAAYERGKQTIHAGLLAQGYLKARLLKHRVEVNLERQEAYIVLHWEAGARFRFGPLSFSDHPFRATFLRRYLPPEDAYLTTDNLQGLSRNLSASPYFDAAFAIPQIEQAEQNAVPIRVELTMAKRSTYEVGVSMGSDSGPGVQADAKRNWVNSRGHRALAQLEFSTKRKLAAGRYEWPSAKGFDRSSHVDLNYVDEQTDSSDRATWRLGINQSRRWRDWSLTLALTALAERFRLADQQDRSFLLIPSVDLAQTRTDNPIDPSHGWRAQMTTSAAAEAFGADTSFLRLEALAKRVYSPSDRQRFLVRGRVGGLWADDFEQLPSSLRFFSGGDRSVRGFDFEQLGPRRNGQVIGGEYVAEASVEFDYRFRERWRWAVFADGGNALGSSDNRLEYAAGLGLRWLSPIGPLRLDVAKPLSRSEESIRFHFSAGPDL